MLRHYNTSQTQLGFLNAKVAEAQKTLKDALYTADTVSKDQDKKIKALEETVANLNNSMDELKKTTKELTSANEKEKEKSAAQERKNELLTGKVTMLEENLATGGESRLWSRKWQMLKTSLPSVLGTGCGCTTQM